jgi:predicted ATPase/DNA-binding XRE family transcriptional regulator
MEGFSSFGEWLTEYRQSLHLQRAELAARLGCATVTLRKIEIDERRPSRQLAEQLAEQLGIAPTEREVFIRVARGELPVTRLPRPQLSKPIPTSLPHPATSFSGRERELEEIQNLLSRPEVRLLTLSGAPGVGKTRLALEAARQLQSAFPDGVFFVALATLDNPELVLATVAHTLQLGTPGKQSLVERLSTHLRPRQILLVLDNFEHLLAAAPHLATLLVAAPRLKLLVTSRIALELAGEHRLTVLPLGVPPEVENSRVSPTSLSTSANYSAVELFIERARTVNPKLVLNEVNLRKITQLCRRLDGLPLAIEFVAARCAFFTPQELLDQLDDRVTLLTRRGRDVPTRHLTLTQALDWSYSLLSEADQQLFCRLGVFVGSFTLRAAEEICNSDGAIGKNIVSGITTLVTSSLVERQEDYEESSRFKLLQTVREYALKHLEESREAKIIRARHAAYFLGLAQNTERAWDGPHEWNWLQKLVAVRDDLRAVLRYGFETRNITLALSLNAALFSFWLTCSTLKEAREAVEATLALAQAEDQPELTQVKAKVLNLGGYIATGSADYLKAYHYFEQALALYRQLEDRQLEDKRGVAWSIRGCALVKVLQAKYSPASELLEESLKLCQANGDEWGLAWTLYALAFLRLAEGNLSQAQVLLEEALIPMRRQNISIGVIRTLLALGYTRFEEGEREAAEDLFREALGLIRESPILTFITTGLDGMAMIAAARGKLIRAARLWGAVEVLREMTGEQPFEVYHRIYEQLLTQACAELGKAEWGKAWGEGRGLTIAEALAEGLEGNNSLDRSSSSSWLLSSFSALGEDFLRGTVLPL